jgi:hypothetical protein
LFLPIRGSFFLEGFNIGGVLRSIVMNKPWDWIPIVKPPVVQPLQDVLSLSELAAIISRTRKRRYHTHKSRLA